MPIFVALVLNKNHFGTYLNRLATITTTHVPKYYRITPRKSAERRPFLEPHSSRFPTAVSCLKNRGGGGCVGGGFPQISATGSQKYEVCNVDRPQVSTFPREITGTSLDVGS